MKAFAHVLELGLLSILAPVFRILRLTRLRRSGVAIVGWWGSETVGDVAILGQLLRECREVAPGARFTVVSFDLAVTTRTLRELGASDVSLASVGIHSAWELVNSRCVIVGGGPLMESRSMIAWAWRIRLTRIAGIRTLCYANGIGPIRTKRTAQSIVALLQSSAHVVLRDNASRDWLMARAPEVPATVAFDPAFDFVRSRQSVLQPERRTQLALALRAPPPAYLDRLESGQAVEAFLDLVAASLNVISSRRPVLIVGVVMYDGAGDCDDHAMYRRLRAKLVHPELLTVRPGRHAVDEVVRDIAESCAVLTVRFHAMIVALATGTPFIAVDYARPVGKVSNAAAMVGRDTDVVTWDALDCDWLAARLELLLDAGPAAVPSMDSARLARLNALHETLR